MIILVPAYGRDYKNQASALQDFNADKDFQVISMVHGGGGYTNKADLEQIGVQEVAIRYNNQKLKFYVKLGVKTQSA